MSEVTFYGVSEDVLVVEGHRQSRQFHAVETIWRGDLIAPCGEQLRVHAVYDGCWQIGVGPVDEDTPLAPWPLVFEQHGRGSVALIVEAPDGTRLANTGEPA